MSKTAERSLRIGFLPCCGLHEVGDNLAQRGEVDGPRAVERALARRHRIFEAGCAIEKHGLFAPTNAPVGETLFERGIRVGTLLALEPAIHSPGHPACDGVNLHVDPIRAYNPLTTLAP